MSEGLKFMILLLSGLVGLVLVMSLLVINRLRKKRTLTGSQSSSRKDLLLNISYESLLKATGGFSSANIIGAGSFGSVCKGILDPDQTVVSVRDFKPCTRLSIAIDVASALEYLHHHSEKPIVHCDSKPSNFLLDNDMTTHVEYGMGNQFSTNGDVYSYGKLLLEIFTGKRSTSDMFTEGLGLHNFVKMAVPDQISEVLDPLFVAGGEEGEKTAEENIKKGQIQESLITILKIRLVCSIKSPQERMDTSDVVNNLQTVKSTLVRCGIR
ncbi:hypothetical protein AB3S75_032917 [Citrus x aurantiifolia]